MRGAGIPSPRVAGAGRRAVAAGATLREVSRAIGRAAVHRVARYPANNAEDWGEVLHVISYANAFDGLAGRLDGGDPEAVALALRGALHGAVHLALTHFLNAPRPGTRQSGGSRCPKRRANSWSACSGAASTTCPTRRLEAGVAWHQKLAPHPDAHLALAATARYVCAQRGRRILLSNTTHALRLVRGEAPAAGEGGAV